MSNKIPHKTIKSDAVLKKLADKLDLEDKVKDGRVSQLVYNDFARNIGLAETHEKFISVDEVIANTDILIKNAPEIILNEMEHRYGTKLKAALPEEPATKKENQQTDTSFFGKVRQRWNNAMSGASSWIRRQVDENIEDYLNSCTIDEARSIIQSCTDLLSNEYPLASKLLDLSVSPKDMTVGRHNNYTVLNAQQSRNKLASFGMRENDSNVYGNKVDHFTSDKMNLKTVVFDKTSAESKIISNTDLVRKYATYWINNGKIAHEYLGGHLTETTDCKLGINSCIVGGMKSVDNGKTITVSGYIEDVYDFDETYYNYGSFLTDRINRAACVAQKNGAIQNYRVLIPFTVTIPKSELK